MNFFSICCLILLCTCPVSAESQPKIDIVLRAFERETPLLLMFLRSFEIFFPMEHLGELFVVLDKTKRDRAVGSVMPAYAQVVYEDHVGINTNYVNPHENRDDSGRSTSQISNFFSDQYGQAEIIGTVDSDVVFRAPAMYGMLVADGLPRLFCSHHRGQHRLGGDAARRIDPAFKKIPEDFSCMENFPFLMWRASYPRMRSWLGDKLQTRDVKKSLADLVNSANYYNFFGNFALMGYYLFTYEREQYSLVVGGNGKYSTCPELRPSLHVHYSMQNWRQFPDKLSWDYFRTASRAIHNGVKLCSNSTSADRKLQTVHSFLSLEGNNELMFGLPGSLAKPGCEEHLNLVIEDYLDAVKDWCEENYS